MAGILDTHRTGRAGAVERIVTVWALLGGGLLLVVVTINVLAVVGSAIGVPLPGDVELTEMGVAIAVFAFLPYCQMIDANVTADIFTAGAGPRMLAALRALASLIALLFAAILVWRMYEGMLDQRQYNYITTILQIPVWWAFVPILVSLLLLIVAAVVNVAEAARRTAKQPEAGQ